MDDRVQTLIANVRETLPLRGRFAALIALVDAVEPLADEVERLQTEALAKRLAALAPVLTATAQVMGVQAVDPATPEEGAEFAAKLWARVQRDRDGVKRLGEGVQRIQLTLNILLPPAGENVDVNALIAANRAIAAAAYTTENGGCCARCGAWAPHGHPEAHEHRGECGELQKAARRAQGLVREAAPKLLGLLAQTQAKHERCLALLDQVIAHVEDHGEDAASDSVYEDLLRVRAAMVSESADG